MTQINWDASTEDIINIEKIADRAEKLTTVKDRLNLTMDITACHLNGCALNLEKLLSADDFNFLHDLYGISNNLDRTTGKLMNCFLPRCSA